MGRGHRYVTDWYVPPQMWGNGATTVLNGGVGCDANGNVIIPIVDATLVQLEPLVVERMLFQYNIWVQDTGLASALAFSRIYLSETDISAGAYDLANLNEDDEAERAFMWQGIDIISNAGTSTWWQGAAVLGGQLDSAPRIHQYDVRVKRKVEGTQSLIWHTQLPFGVVGANAFKVQVWMRALVREGA